MGIETSPGIHERDGFVARERKDVNLNLTLAPWWGLVLSAALTVPPPFKPALQTLFTATHGDTRCSGPGSPRCCGHGSRPQLSRPVNLPCGVPSMACDTRETRVPLNKDNTLCVLITIQGTCVNYLLLHNKLPRNPD